MAFHRGETVICFVTVKDSDGNLTDPATSMTIKITDFMNGVEVDDKDMINDSTGTYHYDWTSATTSNTGSYTVIYKAIDGTRITIERDNFELV